MSVSEKGREDSLNFDLPEDKGLIAWFAHNHVAANIMMILFIVAGFYSVMNIRNETFPSIDPKTITITVSYPGATPYEVADSITSRAESALRGTEGVKRISSTASEGSARITVEMEEFADSDEVYDDVETSINNIVDYFPGDAERPVITKTKRTQDVMRLALYGNVSEEILKYWADTIEDELLSLSGIALTSVSGTRDYQISVEVAEENLRRYGMTLQDIGSAISAFSVDVPAGTVESQQGDVVLRIQEKSYTGKDFEKIVLRTLDDGSKLHLGDIATIIDGFEDTNLVSKFNGMPAAFVQVNRSDTQDVLEVANTVKAYLEDVKLPEGLHLTIQEDDTQKLKERMSLMMRNAILGFVLVFLILLLFLDLKLAFWTSAAIPVSFLGGLMIIFFMGYSLNMITLFALIVVLGIVVDDAIVIGESIFESQEKEREYMGRNKRGENAVLRGVYLVAAPVTIGVLTTMAAFAPLIFSTGTLGQIIRYIPIVVIPILFISLLEAYFILPSHLSNPRRWSKGIMATLRNKFSAGLYWFINHMLVPVSRFVMQYRYATLAAFIGLSIVTYGLFASGTVRFIFFPRVEGNRVLISATMEEGTPFSVTEKAMTQIEKEVLGVRETLAQEGADPFEAIQLSIGESSSGGGPGGPHMTSSSNAVGQVRITLVTSDLRKYSAAEIEAMVRKRIVDIPNIESLEFQSSMMGNDADVELELSHADADQLNAAAEALKEAMKKIDGTKEVDDSFELGKTEYVFELTDEGLSVGLTPTSLGQQLRYAFFGLEAQRVQRGDSEILVYVRYPKEQRESLTGLENTRIRLSDGSEVPLSSVARIKKQLGYSQIFTVDGRRIVTVSGDVDLAVTTPDDVISVLTTDVLPDLQGRYPGLSYSFEGKSREQKDDLGTLKRNMLIALMVIYVLIGGQLRSYIQPLIIMSAIPFGIIGAVWGHFLLGYDISFLSLFGMVALTGVVVNDSVVLVDYFNGHKNEFGKSTYDALSASVARRFRPILLTTLTTSLGLLPMLLETSLQAQFLIPMVVSLATGILFSTTVILILVPCLLLIVEDIRKGWFAGLKAFNLLPDQGL